MKCGKRVIALALSFVIAIVATFVGNTVSSSTLDSINNAIKGAFSYKYSEFSADNTSEFLKELSKNAGDYTADWYYIALSRYGISCDNKESINALKNAVDDLYNKGLENVKATDMQRIALALLSCDVDIKNVNGHNLLADCTYNREKYAPLDKQGVNSLAFALIVLDSKDYSVPNSAKLSRNDIIEKIIENELTNGGFSIVGTNPDPDVTAIVLQSLAPYYSKDKVNNVINRGLNYISKLQQTSGAFKSFGKANAESTAQVILALTSLNIDILKDSRFIKNGNSSLDGLMTFLMKDGGFCHIKGYSSDNMATYQSLCALISCYRYFNNLSRFYCYNPDNDVPEQSTEFLPENKVNSNNSTSSKSDKKQNKITLATEVTASRSAEKRDNSTDKNKSNTTASESNSKLSPNIAEKYPTSESSAVNDNKYYSINHDKNIVAETNGYSIDIIFVFLILIASYMILVYVKTRGVK